MARPATGSSALEAARKQLLEARTLAELRAAQAVILPLVYGLSMQSTAEVLGMSKGWTCQMRREFIAHQALPEAERTPKAKPGSGMGRAYLKQEEERAFLLPFVEKASQAGILIVHEIRQALDKKLGRRTSLGTTYNLLHRHGWRKLAPDKQHPKADVAAQDDWKKNFLSSYEKLQKTGKEQAAAKSG